MTTWKARPTTYKGIPMRSRLEASFAAWLDDEGFEWEYEPRAFADQSGQYLPDFAVWFGDRATLEQPAYVEVKPTVDQAYAVRDRMEIIWSSDAGALLFAWVPYVDFILMGTRHPDAHWKVLDVP